jgi:methionyl-tRNA synthetase
MKIVLYVLVELLRATAIYMQPIIPKSSELLLNQLNIPDEFRTFSSIGKPLPVGITINKPTILFPKIETESSKAAANAKGKR